MGGSLHLPGARSLMCGVLAAGEKPREGARQQAKVVVRENPIYEAWGFAPAIVSRDGTI